ncbi:hypothetical protein [Ornithinimicrobium kibberense]|uniref:hypothetical protein n=1 Tax=Ornithinimicrobium kibberense TaxID=282060 RepID=UPI0036065D35
MVGPGPGPPPTVGRCRPSAASLSSMDGPPVRWDGCPSSTSDGMRCDGGHVERRAACRRGADERQVADRRRRLRAPWTGRTGCVRAAARPAPRRGRPPRR